MRFCINDLNNGDILMTTATLNKITTSFIDDIWQNRITPQKTGSLQFALSWLLENEVIILRAPWAETIVMRGQDEIDPNLPLADVLCEELDITVKDDAIIIMTDVAVNELDRAQEAALAGRLVGSILLETGQRHTAYDICDQPHFHQSSEFDEALTSVLNEHKLH